MSANQIEYISPNYGAGHTVAGLPVAFASSSKANRPNVMNQKLEDHPCRVATATTPPIYIPAPQMTQPNDSSRRMVRIIIEMPESLTKNVDEASRYAASQVKRMKTPVSLEMNREKSSETLISKPQRKVKNVQEIIRKVIRLEEENEGEDNDSYDQNSSSEEVISQQRPDHKTVTLDDDKENSRKDDSKKIILRKNRRSRKNMNNKNLREVDGYKKVIKIYRN
jgi:hypothetical protein